MAANGMTCITVLKNPDVMPDSGATRRGKYTLLNTLWLAVSVVCPVVKQVVK